MFKIIIGCIPHTGLNIETSIAVEPLNERLKDTATTSHQKAKPTDQSESGSSSKAPPPPIVFTAEPLVKLRVTTTHAGAEARGEMLLKIDQECSRCCDPKPRELTVPIHLQLRQAPMSSTNTSSTKTSSTNTDDEIGIIFFRDDHADIEPVLHELALVALDIFWKPDLKADGSCALCKLNFRNLISSNDNHESLTSAANNRSAPPPPLTTSNPFKDLLIKDLRGKN